MNKKISFCCVLLSLLTVAFVVAANASLNESESRDVSSHLESETGTAYVSSQFRNQTHDNENEVGLSTHDGLRLNFNYSSQLNAMRPDVEIEIEFDKIVEFRDSNGNGQLNVGEEIRTQNLKSMNASAPSVSRVKSDDNQIGYELEITARNGSSAFKVTTDSFNKTCIVNGTILKPTETKINLMISNFTYQQTNTLLALVLQMSSESEMMETERNLERELDIKSGNATTYFSWEKQAEVDGTNKTVQSQVASSTEGKTITLVYQHGSTIIHDPKIGFTEEQSPITSPSPTSSLAPTPTLRPSPTETDSVNETSTPKPSSTPYSTQSATTEPRETPSQTVNPRATETPNVSKTPETTSSPSSSSKPTTSPTSTQSSETLKPQETSSTATTSPTSVSQTPTETNAMQNVPLYAGVAIAFGIAATVAVALLLRKQRTQ